MYDKRTLLKGTGASCAVVVLVGILVLASGTAYAAPLASAGGFTIEADELRADDFMLYPGVGESSEAQATPVAVIEQRGVEIDGLDLTKEQSVEALPGLSGTVEITFSASDTVTADQQYVKITGQTADTATFNGQVINDQFSEDNNPSEEFQQEAGSIAEPEDGFITDISGGTPGIVLEDTEINAVYLASNEITLPGLEVDLSYNPDASGQNNDAVESSGSDSDSADSGSDEADSGSDSNATEVDSGSNETESDSDEAESTSNDTDSSSESDSDAENNGTDSSSNDTESSTNETE